MTCRARRLRPGLEHMMVVDRRHGDLVDALRLEPLLVDDESRQVVFVAGRGERARQAEQHDGLAGEIILRFDRLRAVGGQEAECSPSDCCWLWARSACR